MAEIPGMGKLGYDRAIVTFSPDGRLFQVEYAREAVKRGSTAIAVTFEDGVVLASVKIADALGAQSIVNEKIQQIDDHIGLVSAGLLGDARVLIDKARVKAQMHRITYDEAIDVPGVVRFLADFKQAHTQYAGLRPMGVSFLIGGVNDHAYLFETDQGGSIFQWNAHAIGRGAEIARKALEKDWKEKLDRKGAVDVAVSTLKKAEKDIPKDNVEIVVIEKGKGFQRIAGKERTDALKGW
ncbi:MAG: archaeal proteasome endopeptidase complex subunit alpha [Candidatus Aenigmarchaeota archaeon]|nr:archaeal proteasome endopeptidase complex subunit alpha [Candidatus Aenigmarchaeota archaeon]